MSDGNPHTTADAEAHLSASFLPVPGKDSKTPRLRTRVSGATTRLKKAGLLEPVSRGAHRITDRGLQILSSTSAQDALSINLEALEISDDRKRALLTVSPREALADAFQRQTESLRAEVLDNVQSCSLAAFEKVVLDLLVAIGYGGPRANPGSMLGRTLGNAGDPGGIEGLIKAHKLGHEALYVQARHWPANLKAPVTNNEFALAFVKTLESVPARKGALITTSEFSQAAREVIAQSKKKILLIDGPELARLMVEHNIGVVDEMRQIVKRLDSSYFGRDA